MDTITYLNLTVNGFPFQKVTSFMIRHDPNQHAIASVTGEVEPDMAQDSLQRTDENTQIEICTTAEGQPSIIFRGCVSDTSLKQDNAYSYVTLTLKSVSRLTDITKRNKTYQNTAATYGQIISGNISDVADLHMMVSDKAIGSLIMQYGETDWEFAKRMASKLNAPLITNLSSARAQLYIGLPPASRTVSETSLFLTTQATLRSMQKIREQWHRILREKQFSLMHMRIWEMRLHLMGKPAGLKAYGRK